MGLLGNLFGGKTKAKATVESVSEAISSVAASTVNECVVNVDQTMDTTIVNRGWSLFGSFKATQATDVASECFSDINRQTQLQNKLVNEIMNATTSEGQALWPAFGNTTATAVTNIRNKITNTVTLSNIQKSYINIKQTMKPGYVNEGISIGDSVDFSQGATAFAAATLKEVERTGVFNDIENYVDQSSGAATAGPFDALTSATMWIVIVLIIVVAIACGVGLWFLFGRGAATPVTVIEGTPVPAALPVPASTSSAV